jgi:hypothetical protein
MVDETAQHAGHADIIRELIDGAVSDKSVGTDTVFWHDRKTRIQAAANHFRGPGAVDAH